jgi:hypothetical protein
MDRKRGPLQIINILSRGLLPQISPSHPRLEQQALRKKGPAQGIVVPTDVPIRTRAIAYGFMTTLMQPSVLARKVL